MKISVVTPVLNGARFISDTIRSVLGQTYNNLDYLVIDAGSTDQTQEIIKREIADDPRASLVVRSGEPLYQSVMWGLGEARGDVLCWLNADDLYTQWAFSAIVKFRQSHPDACWFSGLPACWDTEGVLRYVRTDAWRPRPLIERGWFHKELLGFIQQESIFFSRSLFASLGEDDRKKISSASLAGDFILWKRFARQAPLCLIPTVLGGFRRHGDNQSIVKIADYMREVKEDGAVFLPRLFRGAARRSFAAVSRQRTLAAALAEDTAIDWYSDNGGRI